MDSVGDWEIRLLGFTPALARGFGQPNRPFGGRSQLA